MAVLEVVFEVTIMIWGTTLQMVFTIVGPLMSKNNFNPWGIRLPFFENSKS
jgi:hypothetical protein